MDIWNQFDGYEYGTKDTGIADSGNHVAQTRYVSLGLNGTKWTLSYSRCYPWPVAL